MILWIILFILVLLISYILAARSMRNFTPVSSPSEYGLYLIQNVRNVQQLNLMVEHLHQSGLAVSLERIFQKGKSVLIVFAPRKILAKFIKPLQMVELAAPKSRLLVLHQLLDLQQFRFGCPK